MLTYPDKIQIIRAHQERNFPVNTIKLANDLEIGSYYAGNRGEDFGGMIAKRDEVSSDHPYSIYVNGKHSPQRMRFSLAFAIAYMVENYDHVYDKVTFDTMYRTGAGEGLDNKARLTAVDILVPLSRLAPMLESGVTCFDYMAKKFNVPRSLIAIKFGIPDFDGS